MATLLDLERWGALFRLDAGLDPGVQEFRQIYTSPDLRWWMESTLPGLVSSWNLELTPLEQLDGLINVFCSGDTLTYGQQFKPLTHVKDGIWELKTADLRMFGWFNRKDCFVGVVADDATRIKTYKLYKGYANVTTAGFRDALDLDEPKYVTGDDPHAVVSNFDLP
jgi:hypothetical protein